jgi:hypothetical protein
MKTRQGHTNNAQAAMALPQEQDAPKTAHDRLALYTELERLCSDLGIDVPTAPYWTLDTDDAPPLHYSLPRAIERLRTKNTQ